MNKFIKIGGSGGATSYGGLTDKATVDLPTINTPLATALNGKEATANKKTDVDANKTSDTFYPTVKAVFDWVTGLFVKGAPSSTDNAIARFDGTTGKLIQNSLVTIDDTGSMIVKGSTGSGQTSFDVVHEGGTGSFRILQQSASSYFICSSSMNMYTSGSNRLTITNVGNVGINTTTPTALIDVNGTSRFRSGATFNGQIIDNVGSSGVDGQVLKKVGGLVLWANP